MIDLRIKEDSLHSLLHTWAFSMKWWIKGSVINWANCVFGFFRELGEGLNKRHQPEPETWSREAKAQFIASKRDMFLCVCGGFMQHCGHGGAGGDDGGEC